MAVSQQIEPAFPKEGASLKAAMASISGPLTPQQQRAMLVVESFGFLIQEIGKEIEDTSASMTKLLNETTGAIAESLECGAKVVAFGDFADYSEIVTGVGFCTGEELTRTGKLITVAGLAVGSGKFWRTLADWGGVAVTKGKKVAKNIVEEAELLANIRNASKNVLNEIGKSRFKKITKTPSGKRPSPETYLSNAFVKDHLDNFSDGASYFVPKRYLDDFGRDLLGFPDNSQYVLPKFIADDIIESTGGNIAKMEKILGIPPGDWQDPSLGGLVRIDIPEPKSLNLRMPSGNEQGTNPLWLPGGRLPTGQPEAVINRIPQGSYTEVDVK